MIKGIRKSVSVLLLAGITAMTMLPGQVFAETLSEDSGQEAWDIVGSPDQTGSFEGLNLPDQDDLFAGYVNQVLGDLLFEDGRSVSAAVDAYGISASTEDTDLLTSPSMTARSRLSDNHQKIYDYVSDQVSMIAAGQSDSSVITISLSELGIQSRFHDGDLGVDIFDADGNYNQAEVRAAVSSYLDLSTVINSLLIDDPYNFYWADTVTGYSYTGLAYSYGWYKAEGNFLQLKDTMTITFAVAEDYQAADSATSSGYYVSLDTAKTGAASKAAKNADTIVAAYANQTDYNKLIAYKDSICQLTSYNTEAANDSSAAYGDPWQLIYVFDNDPTTTVVCEGYAKAFQYLCDLTDFDNPEIQVYRVRGTLISPYSSGGHMWNIIHMDDGKNYMADVTNSDLGTIGASGGLFLSGYTSTGSYNNLPAYYFLNSRLFYVYNAGTSRGMGNYYSEEELTLASDDYVVPSCDEYGHVWKQDPVFLWSEDGSSCKITLTCCRDYSHTITVSAVVSSKIVTPATCTSLGTTAYTAIYEGYSQTIYLQDIPATGHHYTVKDNKHIYKEATCSSPALYYYVCTCGEVGTDTYEYGEPTAHNWDDGVITKEPTATEDGIRTYTCSLCGDTKTSAVKYTATELVTIRDSKIYYEKGQRSTITDVISINGTWYNLVNGQVIGDTIAQNSAGWWVIDSNGMVDFTYTGFAQNSAGIFYAVKGKVDFSQNGLVKGLYRGSSKWGYLVNGKVTAGPSIQKYAGSYWYVDQSGFIDFTANTVAKNSAGWWAIENGKVNFNRTGFVERVENGSVWYVVNGHVNFPARGVYKDTKTGKWGYVKGGRLQTGKVDVQKNSAGWWYIGTDGYVNFNFTGIAANSNGNWYIVKGKVNFSYSGTIVYKGHTYKITKGAASLIK